MQTFAERPVTGVEAVAWGLACYGLTLIVTGSYLFRGVRRRATSLHPMLGKLTACPMCFGFWVGAVLAASPSLRFVRAGALPLDVVLNGAAASAWCWICHVILTALGADRL